MSNVPKRIVTDEDMHPVAVQIEYAEWLRIQRLLLNNPKLTRPPTNLSRHAGRLNWPVDGMEYQRNVRSEWD